MMCVTCTFCTWFSKYKQIHFDIPLFTMAVNVRDQWSIGVGVFFDQYILFILHDIIIAGYAFFLLQLGGDKAITMSLHVYLSLAVCSASFQVLSIFFNSDKSPRIHVCFDFLLQRCPCVFQSTVCLVTCTPREPEKCRFSPN